MASSFKFGVLYCMSLVLLLFSFTSPALAEQCESESKGGCHDKAAAMKLKYIAISAILAASMIGVCLPLFSRAVPALGPDKDLFAIVKAFASGVILATGYMHVLPDSIEDLTSECLPENPWRNFPFSTFVAMFSAIFTLMVDSFTMSYHRKLHNKVVGDDNKTTTTSHITSGHSHPKSEEGNHDDDQRTRLIKHRIVAQVLEMGIVVHSVVIGLAMGSSHNPCTIKPLIAALCFHQLFEGMGLGGCILQAEYGRKTNAIMVFFFSTTTPFGIALGIALANVYTDTSPTALIVVGLLNACSAGLLNYMALVDLLANDFMGPKLQANIKLQVGGYVAVLLGAGLMSLMAKWA